MCGRVDVSFTLVKNFKIPHTLTHALGSAVSKRSMAIPQIHSKYQNTTALAGSSGTVSQTAAN